ncbi:MAG: hypothetical protein ACPG8V_05715 [Alphaproteobacteria bacterium]
MKKVLLALLIAGSLTACGRGQMPRGDYDSSAMYGTHEVLDVTIVSHREITVSQEGGIVGKGAGAIIGGVAAGSLTESESESTILAVGGAVLGGIIGDKIEKGMNEVKATEYIVKKKDGTKMAVIVNNNNLRKGDKAILVMGNRPSIRRAD